MLAAVQQTAAEADYLLAVADVRGSAVDPEVFGRYALESRVDGVLLATGLLDDHLVAQLANRGLPVLPVASRYHAVAASVTMDDAMGARLAVDHLVALGHEHIAFIARHRETDIIARREAGYHEAMRRHGLPVDGRWAVAGSGSARADSETWSRESVARLFSLPPDTRPTAALTANLVTTLGLLTAARIARVRLPSDLSVITFDAHPFGEHTDPPVTAIDMPMAEMGTAAAMMLLRAIEGEPMTHVVVAREPRLVERASTGPPD
jgi:LacI family transcriptional regulator